jgi:type I site-specific restriction endonuclease
VQYLDEQGRLITESLKDFTRKTVRKAYTPLDAFLNAWNEAERKQAIIEELASHGVFLEELAEQVGRDYDTFDLVCHVAFDRPPLTRRERAARVKNAMSSPSTAKKPAPYSTRCWRNTPTAASRASNLSTSARSIRSPASARRTKSSDFSAARPTTSPPSRNWKTSFIRRQLDL